MKYSAMIMGIFKVILLSNGLLGKLKAGDVLFTDWSMLLIYLSMENVKNV